MQRRIFMLLFIALYALSLKAQPDQPLIKNDLGKNVRFVGKYDLDGSIVQFVLQNDVLVLVVPGAPIQALRPAGKNKFQSKVFKDQFFRFIENRGQVTAVASEDHHGVRNGNKIGGSVTLLSIAMDSLLVLRKSTEHFLFLYSATDSISVDTIATGMERNYKKILNDFGLKKIASVNVRIYPDLESFHKGINFPGAPSHVLATAFGKNEIRMVSPTNAGPESWMLSHFATHEFTHCVHLNIDYSPNNPRWLWEGVAQYEAGWFFNPAEFEMFKRKQFPSFADLNNGMEYMLGYVIIEAIKDIWGFDNVIRLIKSRGDVQKIFKTSEKLFEEKIYEHIHKKYILN